MPHTRAERTPEWVPPDPHWEDALTSEHHQCAACGRITKGPGKEPLDVTPKHPPHMEHIDAEGRVYSYEEAQAAGLPYNISTGMCPDCMADWRQRVVSGMNRRIDMREWRALFDEREAQRTDRTGELFDEQQAQQAQRTDRWGEMFDEQEAEQDAREAGHAAEADSQ